MASGMLSQEEIDALLRGTLDVDSSESDIPIEDPFTEMEKDAIGEIANISMGTAATTLSLLLGKKVEITTPRVDVTSAEQVRKDYPIPSVIVNVSYKEGIEGSNMLILSRRDGSVIVDLMMGGDGMNPSEELNELQISGIAEAMNQMMGSAATSMSTMFNSVVDISPPSLTLNDMRDGDEFPDSFDPLVRISFRMVVENVIDSILIQVVPMDVAKRMVEKLMGTMSEMTTTQTAAASIQPPSPPKPEPPPYSAPPSYSAPQSYGAPTPPPYMAPPPYEAPSVPSPPVPEPSYSQPAASVQPAQFAPLQPGKGMPQPDNLGLILDVPLQISVELGRAKKTIKEILDMGPGSVIELDRLAGEPVDMIVNGKLIAKCEVVVINETFGIRITDIINPVDRIKTLN